MKTTLAERLKIAMKGPPKVTGKALAAACGVKPPSVSDWLTGKTKTIEGGNLLAAAHCLGVRPEWLANGTGLMRTVEPGTFMVADNVKPYGTFSSRSAGPQLWPFKNVTPEQCQLLLEDEIESVENTILLLIRARSDPIKQTPPATQTA